MKHVKKFIKKNQFVIIIFALCLASASLTNLPITSAVTYQTGVGVSFTFNPKLTLTLSSSNLVISNLAPGTSDNSNEIAITVSTNAAYGYNLSATVGNSTTYNNRDLTHTAGASSGKFQSIAFQADLANYVSSFTTDNTWGYSIDSGTKYNGLPLYSDTTNIATLKSTDTTPATGTDTINFLIGAKAAVTQPTGDYKNVINFMAVTSLTPTSLADAYEAAHKTMLNGYYKLQDMDPSICNMVEVEDDELQVIDTRDNKVYWIAKLKDGHCWMTQNLDLDLGVTTLTHNSTTLYHDDTDLGWGSDTTATSWTPIRGTIDATNGTITGWTNDYNTPYSVDTGDWYYAGYDGTTLLPKTTVNYLTSTNKVIEGNVTAIYNNANHTYAYFKNTPFTGTGTSNNGTHGHVGNYYNWSAAVASNDTSSYNTDTSSDITGNPQNSICPAGWRLPISSMGSTNELSRINTLYNNGSTNTSAGLEASPLFFARSGVISNGLLDLPGQGGGHWSSTVFGSWGASYLYFSRNDTRVTYSNSRHNGNSIRCIAR